VDSIVLTTRFACHADVFNIGTGRPTTINGLVQLLKELLPARDLRVRHLPARKGEVKTSYASIGKAVQVLKFSPRIKLRDGLASLLKQEKLR